MSDGGPLLNQFLEQIGGGQATQEQLVDFIDRQSGIRVNIDVPGSTTTPYFYHDRTGKHDLVARKAAVENRALWFEYRYRGSQGQFLLSDKFWDALNAAGCAGWRPAPFSRGEHIEEI